SGNWLDAVSAMAASVTTGSGSSMTSEAKKMLASAKSGGFMVSEEAAKPIRDVLDRMKWRVEELINELGNIAGTEPALGNHEYGKRVAVHQQEAFAGDEGSAIPVLQALHSVLDDSYNALEIAVKKYSESESSASDVFKGKA